MPKEQAYYFAHWNNFSPIETASKHNSMESAYRIYGQWRLIEVLQREQSVCYARQTAALQSGVWASHAQMNVMSLIK